MSFIYIMSSSKEHSRRQRATDLGNVCFFEAVLPENCGPTLSVWQPQSSFSFVHIQTADISTRWCYLSCVCMIHFSSSLELWPLIPWNETKLIHETMICYVNMTAKRAVYNNIEARDYNTLYDGIILQKRFVKKSNWNVRNTGKKCII
jgi:hypothetical protein